MYFPPHKKKKKIGKNNHISKFLLEASAAAPLQCPGWKNK